MPADQHLGGQRQRHLSSTAVACRAGQEIDGIRTSTALPAAEASGSFMSVMSAVVLRPAPLATSTRLSASCAWHRVLP